MTYKYKAAFEKRLNRLPAADQERIAETVEQLVRFFDSRQAPEGLGVKKLFGSHELGTVFEARASLAIRLVFGVRSSVVTFLCVGNHGEVKQFIRSFR